MNPEENEIIRFEAGWVLINGIIVCDDIHHFFTYPICSAFVKLMDFGHVNFIYKLVSSIAKIIDEAFQSYSTEIIDCLLENGLISNLNVIQNALFSANEQKIQTVVDWIIDKLSSYMNENNDEIDDGYNGDDEDNFYNDM